MAKKKIVRVKFISGNYEPLKVEIHREWTITITSISGREYPVTKREKREYQGFRHWNQVNWRTKFWAEGQTKVTTRERRD